MLKMYRMRLPREPISYTYRTMVRCLPLEYRNLEEMMQHRRISCPHLRRRAVLFAARSDT